MSTLFEQLSTPFPVDRVSWRVGSMNKEKTKCIPLAYIDARDVMDRLDQVVGPNNWQNKYTHTSDKTVCDIALRIEGEWVWKADGAGDSDIEAEKGALSDAFKRAAVRWGIGRYLYDVKTPWVAVEDGKRLSKETLDSLQKYLPNVKKTAQSTQPQQEPAKPTLVKPNAINPQIKRASDEKQIPFTDNDFTKWVPQYADLIRGAQSIDCLDDIIRNNTEIFSKLYNHSKPTHAKLTSLLVAKRDELSRVLLEAAQ